MKSGIVGRLVRVRRTDTRRFLEHCELLHWSHLVLLSLFCLVVAFPFVFASVFQLVPCLKPRSSLAAVVVASIEGSPGIGSALEGLRVSFVHPKTEEYESASTDEGSHTCPNHCAHCDGFGA